MENYAELKEQYPDFLSLDELSRICKIAKRSARYLVSNGIIPAIDTGKPTWRYQICIDDVITYLQSREKYGSMIPPGAVTSRQKSRKTNTNRKSYAEMVTAGHEYEVAEYFNYIYADCDDLLTVENIAGMIGLNKYTIQKMLKKGTIKPIMSRPRYLVPKQHLLEFVVTRHFLEVQTNSADFLKILGGYEIWINAKSLQ